MHKLRDVLARTTEVLARRIEDEPRLEAEHLIAHALGLRRIDLFLSLDRPLAEPELARCRAVLLQRANERLPFAYITGRREFYSLELEVTRDTLVPRSDTELLVEAALDELARRGPAAADARVADVGTGTGAIAIAVAKLAKVPPARVYATDLSPAAAEVARRNVAKHGLAERVEVMVGDLLAPLRAAGLEGKLAILASNPPYIGEPERASLPPEVLAEPPAALFSGRDGLDAIRALVAGAPALLEAGGLLLVEHGWTQGPAVAALARSAGFAEVATKKDLGGRDRLLVARRGR